MKKKVLLNCLPPANIEFPSPSLSILQGYLDEYGFNSEIIYWNLLTYDVLSGYSRNPHQEINFELIPFISLLLEYGKDDQYIHKINSLLHSKVNSPFILDNFKSGSLINEIKKKLLSIIESKLNQIKEEEILLFGFTSKFQQWIPASILASIFKEKYSSVKTIIGGFSNHKECIACLKLFPQFDFGVWGEGENPLKELCSQLINGDVDVDSIPRIISRRNGHLIHSTNRQEKYLPFGKGILPNYENFFKSNGNNNSLNSFIPFETTRGCHWGRCKFCVETYGIKFRKKSPYEIISEMKILSKRYGCNRFNFLDSDTVGNNMIQFEELLDKLISLKIENDEQYEILHAEINPKGFDANLIKKMVAAGFKSVQIGFEAISETLLRKMDKKNSVADNLLFSKLSNKYGLKLSGVNIIIGIPDESESDIHESIRNLHLFRFLLDSKNFKFKKTQMELCKGSKFFKSLSDETKRKWNFNDIYNLLPKNILKDEDRFELFGFLKDYKSNFLWGYFIDLDSYYTNNYYSYRLTKLNEVVLYEEFVNDTVIKELVFNKQEYWEVLSLASDKVISILQIHKVLNDYCNNITLEKLEDIILELKTENLIYCNSDLSEIVTIIDTTRIMN